MTSLLQQLYEISRPTVELLPTLVTNYRFQLQIWIDLQSCLKKWLITLLQCFVNPDLSALRWYNEAIHLALARPPFSPDYSYHLKED